MRAWGKAERSPRLEGGRPKWASLASVSAMSRDVPSIAETRTRTQVFLALPGDAQRWRRAFVVALHPTGAEPERVRTLMEA